MSSEQSQRTVWQSSTPLIVMMFIIALVFSFVGYLLGVQSANHQLASNRSGTLTPTPTTGLTLPTSLAEPTSFFSWQGTVKSVGDGSLSFETSTTDSKTKKVESQTYAVTLAPSGTVREWDLRSSLGANGSGTAIAFSAIHAGDTITVQSAKNVTDAGAITASAINRLILH